MDWDALAEEARKRESANEIDWDALAEEAQKREEPIRERRGKHKGVGDILAAMPGTPERLTPDYYGWQGRGVPEPKYRERAAESLGVGANQAYGTATNIAHALVSPFARAIQGQIEKAEGARQAKAKGQYVPNIMRQMAVGEQPYSTEYLNVPAAPRAIPKPDSFAGIVHGTLEGSFVQPSEPQKYVEGITQDYMGKLPGKKSRFWTKLSLQGIAAMVRFMAMRAVNARIVAGTAATGETAGEQMIGVLKNMGRLGAFTAATTEGSAKERANAAVKTMMFAGTPLLSGWMPGGAFGAITADTAANFILDYALEGGYDLKDPNTWIRGFYNIFTSAGTRPYGYRPAAAEGKPVAPKMAVPEMPPAYKLPFQQQAPAKEAAPPTERPAVPPVEPELPSNNMFKLQAILRQKGWPVSKKMTKAEAREIFAKIARGEQPPAPTGVKAAAPEKPAKPTKSSKSVTIPVKGQAAKKPATAGEAQAVQRIRTIDNTIQDLMTGKTGGLGLGEIADRIDALTEQRANIIMEMSEKKAPPRVEKPVVSRIVPPEKQPQAIVPAKQKAAPAKAPTVEPPVSTKAMSPVIEKAPAMPAAEKADLKTLTGIDAFVGKSGVAKSQQERLAAIDQQMKDLVAAAGRRSALKPGIGLAQRTKLLMRWKELRQLRNKIAKETPPAETFERPAKVFDSGAAHDKNPVFLAEDIVKAGNKGIPDDFAQFVKNVEDVKGTTAAFDIIKRMLKARGYDSVGYTDKAVKKPPPVKQAAKPAPRKIVPQKIETVEKAAPQPEKATSKGFDWVYPWGNNPERAKYKGQRFRVLARSKKPPKGKNMNSILIEFENGHTMVTSANVLRSKAPAAAPQKITTVATAPTGEPLKKGGKVVEPRTAGAKTKQTGKEEAERFPPQQVFKPTKKVPRVEKAAPILQEPKQEMPGSITEAEAKRYGLTGKDVVIRVAGRTATVSTTPPPEIPRQGWQFALKHRDFIGLVCKDVFVSGMNWWDKFQVAIEHVARKAHQFNPSKPANPWLRKAVRSRLIDAAKHERLWLKPPAETAPEKTDLIGTQEENAVQIRVQQVPQEKADYRVVGQGAPEPTSAEKLIDAREKAKEVRAEVAQLPWRLRMVMKMRDNGLSFEEIGKRLGKKRGKPFTKQAMQKRFNEGLEMVRQGLIERARRRGERGEAGLPTGQELRDAGKRIATAVGKGVAKVNEAIEKMESAARPPKIRPDEMKVAMEIERWAGAIVEAEVHGQWIAEDIQKAGFNKEQWLRVLKAAKAEPDAPKDLTPQETEQVVAMRKRFDAYHQLAKEHGILEAYIENYIPHMYYDRPNKAAKALGLGTQFRFAKQRKIPTWAEAEKAGLHPIKDPAVIEQTYRQHLEQVIANRELIQRLTSATGEDGLPLLMPAQDAPSNYRYVNTPAFSRWMYVGQTRKVSGTGEVSRVVRLAKVPYKAHPDIAKQLEDLGGTFRDLPSWLRGWGKLNVAIKKLVMYNPLIHGTNVLSDELITSGGHPVRVWKTGRNLWRTHAEAVEFAARSGLRIITNPSGGQAIADLLGRERASRPPSGWNLPLRLWNLSQKFLWTDIVRNSQLGTWKYQTESLVAKGVPLESAGRIAANFTNDLYGTLPRHWTPRYARILGDYLLFARNWTVSNIQYVTKATAQRGLGMKHLTASERATVSGMQKWHLAKSAVALLATLNVSQYAYWLAHKKREEAAAKAEGRKPKVEPFHFNFENPRRHWLDVDTFTADREGRRTYIIPHLFRYMRDIAGWVTKPTETFRNKLHPIVKVGMEQIEGRDYFGEKIAPEGASFLGKAKGRAAHALKGMTPIDVITGRKGRVREPIEKAALATGTWTRHAPPGSAREPKMAYKMIEQRQKQEYETKKLDDEIDDLLAHGKVREAIVFMGKNRRYTRLRYALDRVKRYAAPLMARFKNMSRKERVKFMKSLSPEERKLLREAMRIEYRTSRARFQSYEE